MSRSYRKPYFGNTESAKEWKAKANRKIRRDPGIDPKALSSKGYKKFNEVWTSPMEHKHGYYDEPRLRRK
jgi:hypothetical protein